jgi:hypothetical protein
MEIKKNFKSTDSLYGVPPLHFENMTYYEAIEEKIKLVRKNIEILTSLLDVRNEHYAEINQQIIECKKAEIFNQQLLDEYKKYKKAEKNGYL